MEIDWETIHPQPKYTKKRYFDHVVEALILLDDKRGLTREELTKFLQAKRPHFRQQYLTQCLRHAVTRGSLLHIRGRFRLPPGAKCVYRRLGKESGRDPLPEKAEKKSRRKQHASELVDAKV